MNKYEKVCEGFFFSGQVKNFQGRQKLQVTCPAGQVVSNVNIEPCQSYFLLGKMGPDSIGQVDL